MNKSIHSIAIAFAVIAVLSFGMTTYAHAQNATTPVRDHDRDRDHFGILGGFNRLVNPYVREHLGVGVLGSTVGGTVVANTGVVRPDFDRYHNWAFAHHDHFLYFGNRYIVLPSTVACPPGSQLNAVTGECQVVNQVILTQQAPIIQQEQVQVDPSQIVSQASTATVVQGQTTVVGQPIVTCPQGSLQNGQCVVQTQSQQIVAPNVSCAVGSLVNGQCVEQQQQIVVGQSCGCPDGASAVNGQCVVNALPSQVQTISPGEIVILGHHFHHEGGFPWAR